MSRSRLTTPLVATSTLALLLATFFAVQAVALGRPAPVDLLVARTARALAGYQRVASRIVVDGRHVEAVCDQRWQRRRRFAFVRLDGRRLPLRRARTLGRLAAAELELAGCPRALTAWLAIQVNHGVALELAAARVGRVRLYALRPAARRGGLWLYLVRPGGLPVALALRLHGIRGRSALRFGAARDLAAASERGVTRTRLRRPLGEARR